MWAHDGRRIGYVRVLQFSEEEGILMKEELRRLGRAIDGYVIDLRNCPGGQTREAMAQVCVRERR